MPVSLRAAEPGDTPIILAFIRELAAYERLAHEAVATEEGLSSALFGPNPRVFCEIAERDGEAVGFALWFYNFSTFVGQCGLYLEDLYVRPEARGCGVGRALLQRLAKRCVAEGLGRFEWSVLDWNTPAIAFYDSLGTRAMDDWTIRRLEGDAREQLAK